MSVSGSDVIREMKLSRGPIGHVTGSARSQPRQPDEPAAVAGPPRGRAAPAPLLLRRRKSNSFKFCARNRSKTSASPRSTTTAPRGRAFPRWSSARERRRPRLRPSRAGSSTPGKACSSHGLPPTRSKRSAPNSPPPVTTNWPAASRWTWARPRRGRGTILVAAAGTADLPVAEEAAVTAEIMGNSVDRLYDVGVAGLHRLLSAARPARRRPRHHRRRRDGRGAALAWSAGWWTSR